MVGARPRSGTTHLDPRRGYDEDDAQSDQDPDRPDDQRERRRQPEGEANRPQEERGARALPARDGRLGLGGAQPEHRAQRDEAVALGAKPWNELANRGDRLRAVTTAVVEHDHAAAPMPRG